MKSYVRVCSLRAKACDTNEIVQQTLHYLELHIDPSLDVYVAFCPGQTSFQVTVNSDEVFIGGGYTSKKKI
jgi:hypothetical protein